LRKEIHSLKEIIGKKERQYELNLISQKKSRDEDLLNIIENSATSINKSAIVSLALTKLKDQIKNHVDKDFKDLNI